MIFKFPWLWNREESYSFPAMEQLLDLWCDIPAPDLKHAGKTPGEYYRQRSTPGQPLLERFCSNVADV